MKLAHSLLIAVMCLCISPSTLLSQTTPVWVRSNVGNSHFLHTVDFPAGQSDIGFIAGSTLNTQGDGIVLKTTDGGNQWFPIWNGVNKGVMGASFPAVQTGYIAGLPDLSTGWSGLGKTVDGGLTWASPVVASDIISFTDVVFKDEISGILLGSSTSGGVVYVTSNGGASWTNAAGVLANTPQHACHVSGNTYYLVDDGGNIKKSLDNGLTWTTVYSLPGTILKGIEFFDDQHGLACGNNGLLIRTTDGGVNWIYQVGGSYTWYDHGWLSSNHVFCCGDQELVLESTDGGVTWLNGYPTSPHEAQLFECIFTANGTGFICGSQGTLLRRAPECTAAFTAGVTMVCTNDQVMFQNQSTGTTTTFTWFFEGGTPSMSQNADPVVLYQSPGIFDVQLIVSNGLWSDTLLKSDYITIKARPSAPMIWSSGDTLFSNSGVRNQWYFNGSAIPEAIGQRYVASQSGLYWDVVTDNDCQSDTSNNIHLIITGGISQSAFRPLISLSEGTLRIEMPSDASSAGCYALYIMTTHGQTIYSESCHERSADGVIRARPGDLKPGIYIIIIKSGAKVVSGKLLVLESR